MFLGFVCKFLRPVEAYFDFPCISVVVNYLLVLAQGEDMGVFNKIVSLTTRNAVSCF